MRVDKKNLDKLTKQLKELGRTKIEIGCHPGTHPGSNLSYSELMDIQERGRTIKNGWGKEIRITIPGRHPIERGLNRTEEIMEAFENIKNANVSVYKGVNVKAIQNGLGEFMVEMIKSEINQGLTPALSETTMKIRARQGVGGNLPLLGATHQLRDSVDFQVAR
jgi:hypothetical protein